MAAQSGDEQGVVMPRQRINDKVFIRRIVVGTGRAIQQATDARKNSAQEREGLGTILWEGAERFTLFRGGDRLAAVVFTDFQRVFF